MNRPTTSLLVIATVAAVFAGCLTKDKPFSTKGVIGVRGASLDYTIEGTGIPVLVPGSVVCHPKAFSPRLREHMRLVFVNTRFFTDSDIDLVEITMDTMVDDLEETRKTLGLGKVAVMGHSTLALVALEYAKKYPDNVSHLVMIGTMPVSNSTAGCGKQYWDTSASKERKRIREENWRELSQEALMAMSPEEAFVSRYLADTPQRWYDPDYDASWLWDGVTPNVDVIEHFVNAVLPDYEIGRSLETITVPVFLALGKHDYLNPSYLWDDFKPRVPTLSIYVFEKSGHFPMCEETELFDRQLIEWIRAN